MRVIKRIVLHCTSGWPTQTTASIIKGWFDPKSKGGQGWKSVGYHRLIGADGKIEKLADLSAVTNGVAGYNQDSVHICYKGGLVRIDKSGKKIYGDTRTEAQIKSFGEAIVNVLWELSEHQDISGITIVGHRDMSKDLNGNDIIEEREWVKVCPTFDAIKEYGGIMGEKARELIKKRSTY